MKLLAGETRTVETDQGKGLKKGRRSEKEMG